MLCFRQLLKTAKHLVHQAFPSTQHTTKTQRPTTMSASAPIPDILKRADEAIDFSSAEIIVIVGPARKYFPVHEALIRKSSAYFETALDQKWLEGRSRVVEMEEDDEQAFNIYINWLYRGKICLDIPHFSSTDELDTAWTRMFRAYALGDKLCDINFKDSLTDAAAVWFTRTGLPSAKPLHTLYESTLPGSPMRLLMTCELAKREDQIKSIDESWPHALTIDLVKLLKFPNEHFLESSFQLACGCAFHEHSLRRSLSERCYRAGAKNPAHAMQRLCLQRLDTIDFATRSIRFMLAESSATFSINERLLRICQPALEFSVESKEAGVWTLRSESNHLAFNIYLNWLCSGRMYVDFAEDSNSSAIWIEIALAYDLGRQLQNCSFSDAIIDAVALTFCQKRVNGLTWIPTEPETLEGMYQVFRGESGLCRLIAYKMATLTNLVDLLSDQWPSKLLHAIAVDAARRLNGGADSSTLKRTRECKFHEHGILEECYRKKMA